MFCARCSLGQWLDPPLSALQYVHPDFPDDVIFSNHGASGQNFFKYVIMFTNNFAAVPDN